MANCCYQEDYCRKRDSQAIMVLIGLEKKFILIIILSFFIPYYYSLNKIKLAFDYPINVIFQLKYFSKTHEILYVQREKYVTVNSFIFLSNNISFKIANRVVANLFTCSPQPEDQMV